MSITITSVNHYCTIYLVRHGETEWNVTNRMQGQTNSPLTKVGREQAQGLAYKLRRIKFAAVYSSDLGRAQQTAEIELSGWPLNKSPSLAYWHE